MTDPVGRVTVQDSVRTPGGSFRNGKFNGRLWRKHVDRVLPEILDLCDRFLVAPIYCEENGDKGFLVKEIKGRDHYAKGYQETENKLIKISTHLRKWWSHIVFVEGTDMAYINQILDYTEQAEHDDAPDSAACVQNIGEVWILNWRLEAGPIDK